MIKIDIIDKFQCSQGKLLLIKNNVNIRAGDKVFDKDVKYTVKAIIGPTKPHNVEMVTLVVE